MDIIFNETKFSHEIAFTWKQTNLLIFNISHPIRFADFWFLGERVILVAQLDKKQAVMTRGGNQN